MSLTGNTVLSFKVLSFSNRSLTMPVAGSIGTGVNRAVTLYELRHSQSLMLPNWPVQQLLGTVDVVWGLTNQWLKYFGKYLSHFIGNRSMAGHYRPDGGVQLVDLGEPIEFGALQPMEHMSLYVLLSNPV